MTLSAARLDLHGLTGERLTPDDIATYVRAYKQHGGLRGALEDYRAAEEDVRQDHADQAVKIACPTLALWGADYYAVGKMFDMPQVWAEMAGESG